MKAFRERNPTVIGTVGLVVIALLLWGAFNAQNLPIIGGGTMYTAQFSEAAGLRTDDEVRIAGVKVGKVESVELDGDHVAIRFRVKDAWVGDESRVDIKIRTLLGRKYLSVDPRGAHKLDPDKEIPLARTTSPFDVVDALNQLTTTVGEIDTTQLAQAFGALSQTFQNTPRDVRGTVDGLSRLSRTIASRDAALRTLLSRTRAVSQVLAERRADLTALFRDGNLLLQEVQARRQVIHDLLQNTSLLALQLQGLVQDNQDQLAPALTQVQTVVNVLKQNQRNLDQSISLLAPFVRVFANTLGNGRWFDTYVQNLLTPIPAVPQIVPSGGG